MTEERPRIDDALILSPTFVYPFPFTVGRRIIALTRQIFGAIEINSSASGSFMKKNEEGDVSIVVSNP